MDPLSIAAGSAGLVMSVVQFARDLATVYDKHKNAQRLIFMIQAECVVLSAALSQIQLLFTSSHRTKNCPANVMDALDISMLGCTLTLSVLSKELEGLQIGERRPKRVKYVWKEQTINDLLLQLRAQSSALNLLLKAFDSYSSEQTIKAGSQFFQKVKRGADSIREAYPEEKYPQSILEMPIADTRSLYSLDKSIDDFEKPWSAAAPHGAFVNNSVQSPSPATPYEDLVNRFAAQDISQQESRNQTVPSQEDDEDFDPTPWVINTEPKVKAALQSLVGEKRAPALVIGKVGIDNAPVIRYCGVRKRDHANQIAQNDRFLWPIAFTVLPTLLAMLIEGGLLQWETTLETALPKLAKRMHVLHKNTTLKMLASHRSGIKNQILTIDGGNLATYLRRPELDGRQGRLAVALSILCHPPDSSPGTFFVNSLNIVLLCLVMEERTSQDITRLVRERIFQPLEMYNTEMASSIPLSDDTVSEPCSHDGNGKFFKSDAAYTSSCYSVGNAFRCPIADVLKFLSFHLRGLLGKETGLLSQSSFEILHAVSERDEGALSYNAGGWWSFDNGVAWADPWVGPRFLCSSISRSGFHGLIYISSRQETVYAAVTNCQLPLGRTTMESAVKSLAQYDNNTGQLKVAF